MSQSQLETIRCQLWGMCAGHLLSWPGNDASMHDGRFIKYNISEFVVPGHFKVWCSAREDEPGELWCHDTHTHDFHLVLSYWGQCSGLSLGDGMTESRAEGWGEHREETSLVSRRTLWDEGVKLSVVDRLCFWEGEEAKLSISIALSGRLLSGDTHLLKELTAIALQGNCLKLRQGHAPAVLMDTRKATLEWCASDRSSMVNLCLYSTGPAAKNSQLVSMDWHCVEVCHTSLSRACNSSDARDGGVDRAMWIPIW